MIFEFTSPEPRTDNKIGTVKKDYLLRQAQYRLYRRNDLR